MRMTFFYHNSKCERYLGIQRSSIQPIVVVLKPPHTHVLYELKPIVVVLKPHVHILYEMLEKAIHNTAYNTKLDARYVRLYEMLEEVIHITSYNTKKTLHFFVDASSVRGHEANTAHAIPPTHSKLKQ
jgi:hypothetical protein